MPGRKKKDTTTPLDPLDPPMLPTCLDLPPYPTGAGPGCIFWGDGIHGHWSDAPAEGSTPVWSNGDWHMTNPALAAPKNGDKPNGDLEQPM